jgi:gamma-glutamyl hydrolase
LTTKRILISGGASNFSAPDDYRDAARHLFNHAIPKNSQGNYFPVWGTCLGFELLTYLANGNKNILADFDAENVALPLEFKPGKHFP